MEKNELFSLELNEEGIYWVRRFQSLAMFVLIATIFYNGMNLYNTLPYIFDTIKDHNLPRKWLVGNMTTIVYMIVHATLLVIHVFFYYQFAVISRQAMNEQNSFQFNKSFRFLYWQSLALVVQVCFSLAYFLFSSVIKNLN
jgi:hypothetical protein